MKILIIDTPKGQYSLPLQLVAEHKADNYGKQGSEEWNDEVKYVMDDDFEGIDWLLNNSDWDEWKDKATKINDKVNVTDEDFWTSSDNVEIEDDDAL